MTWKVASKSAGVKSASLALRATPALLTTMSTWKGVLVAVAEAEARNWALVAATRAEGPWMVPRSACTPKVWMPYLDSSLLESSLVRAVEDLEV